MTMEQTDIYTCPHCGFFSPINTETSWELYFWFGESTDLLDYDPRDDDIYDIDNSQDLFRVEMKRCEECGNDTVSISCIRGPSRGLSVQVSPRSLVKKLPNYVPFAIRQDYEEAHAIVSLSPKAAATLARRCLQGVIRDFWKITGKKTLYQEIDALKELIDPKLWQAMDDVRNIGNIGAHMEGDVNYIIDVDPDEANIILDVIDHIITATYIARETIDKLLDKLHTISEEKNALKNIAMPNTPTTIVQEVARGVPHRKYIKSEEDIDKSIEDADSTEDGTHL